MWFDLGDKGGGVFSSLALKGRQRDLDSKSKQTYSPTVKKDKGTS